MIIYFFIEINLVRFFFIKKFNVTFDEDLKFEDIKQINFLDEELKGYGYKKEKLTVQRAVSFE